MTGTYHQRVNAVLTEIEAWCPLPPRVHGRAARIVETWIRWRFRSAP